MTFHLDNPPPARRLEAIPSGCDCVWSVHEIGDGCRAGSIYIASNKCMRHMMHPRTFSESKPPTEPGAQ